MSGRLMRLLAQLSGGLLIALASSSVAGSVTPLSAIGVAIDAEVVGAKPGAMGEQHSCDEERETSARRWLDEQGLVRALSRAEAALQQARQAEPDASLLRLRDLSSELSALAETVESASTTVNTEPSMGQQGGRCQPSASDLSSLLKSYVQGHALLDATVELQLAPATLLLHSALQAFFQLPLLRAPAPDSCVLRGDVKAFEWQVEPLRLAILELKKIPAEPLRKLRLRVAQVDAGSVKDVLAQLPAASCQQLTHLVCHHLKGARRPQGSEQSLSSLRGRAASLQAATTELEALSRRSEKLGCGTNQFGSELAEDYALGLLQDASEALQTTSGDVLERIVSGGAQKRAGTKKAELGALRSSAAFVKLQHMEAATLAVAVAEPALGVLTKNGQKLTAFSLKWLAVVSELAPSRQWKRDEAAEKYLGEVHAYEQFVGLLLMRPNDACELVKSRFAGASFLDAEGLFAARGRALRRALISRCAEEGARGSL